MVDTHNIVEAYLREEDISHRGIYLVGGAVFRPDNFNDYDMVVKTNHPLAISDLKKRPTPEQRKAQSALIRRIKSETGIHIDLSFYTPELKVGGKCNLGFVVPYYDFSDGKYHGFYDFDFTDVTFKKYGINKNTQIELPLNNDQYFYCINRKELKVITKLI